MIGEGKGDSGPFETIGSAAATHQQPRFARRCGAVLLLKETARSTAAVTCRLRLWPTEMCGWALKDREEAGMVVLKFSGDQILSDHCYRMHRFND
jgi:hypothetical protein